MTSRLICSAVCSCFRESGDCFLAEQAWRSACADCCSRHGMRREQRGGQVSRQGTNIADPVGQLRRGARLCHSQSTICSMALAGPRRIATAICWPSCMQKHVARRQQIYGESEVKNDRWMLINDVPARSEQWLAGAATGVSRQARGVRLGHQSLQKHFIQTNSVSRHNAFFRSRLRTWWRMSSVCSSSSTQHQPVSSTRFRAIRRTIVMKHPAAMAGPLHRVVRPAVTCHDPDESASAVADRLVDLLRDSAAAHRASIYTAQRRSDCRCCASCSMTIWPSRTPSMHLRP